MESLVLVNENELEVIVKNSGLEIAEGEQIKQSYQPFLLQLAVIQEQSEKINFANPAELDETIARELRLNTVKIRTGASNLKESRKRGYLLRGNLEQAAYNLIAASCKLAEDAFTKVEKAREIAEAKRIEELRISRTVELSRFGWQGSMSMNVGKLDDQTYNAMLAGLKKAEEDRIAEEKRIEAERIAAAKKAEEERIAMIAENERLRKEAEKKEKALAAERAKVEAERKEAEEKVRKEREAAAKKLAEERRIAAEKLEKEQKEARRLAAELQAKKDAEEVERKRKEQEKKDRIEAEKNAAAAPDKQKLLSSIDSMTMPQIDCKTAWGQLTEKVIREKFESFKEWAKKEINKEQNYLNL